MPQIHSVCPICDTPIQEITIDQCEKCRWVIGIDDSLNPPMQYRLREWSRRYYKSTIDYSKELEKICQDKYKQKKLEDRLNRQSDDIDYLKAIVPQILTGVQEVKTILTTRDKTSSEDNNISDANTISIEYRDNSQSKIEEKESITIDSQEEKPSRREESSYKTSELTPAQQAIISDYYHKPRDFAAKYQTKIANITKNSINSNRGSEDKIVILEENSRGNYWIFSFADCNYLVPVEDKYINQHSYTTTSTIFEGHNYTPDYQKIQLVKPAIVSIDPNTNPQTWRLQQQGELVFL